MPTTPLSLINRIMGVEAFTDPLTLPAGTTIGGKTVDDAGKLVTVAAATTTLTLTQALHSGKILLLASTAGLAITPPAATGSGATYEFFVAATISGGSVTIDAKAGNGSDTFAGRAYQLLVGTGETVYACASNSNLITLNGTTTGGVIGDLVKLVDMGLHQWYVFVDSTASGSVVTPFSHH